MHHRGLRVVENRTVLRLLATGFLARRVVQLVAEVPVARSLQQVAADRRGVTNLRSRGVCGRCSQRWVPLSNRRMTRDLSERRQRAEAQSGRIELHATQRIDALQVDDARRSDDAFLHEIEQIHPARLGYRRAALIRRQQRHGFLHRLRIDPLQAVHG
jgi:hypothetical protein